MERGRVDEQEIEEVAARVFDWYWAFKKAGFSQDQAIRLCVFLLTDGI